MVEASELSEHDPQVRIAIVPVDGVEPEDRPCVPPVGGGPLDGSFILSSVANSADPNVLQSFATAAMNPPLEASDSISTGEMMTSVGRQLGAIGS